MKSVGATRWVARCFGLTTEDTEGTERAWLNLKVTKGEKAPLNKKW